MIPATFKTVVDTFWIEEPYNKQYPSEAVFADDFEEVKDVVERRVLVQDESTREVDVPAKYKTVEKRVITKKGGMTAWREVPCTLPQQAIILPINYEL